MALELREFQAGDEAALLTALGEFCRREHPGRGRRTREEWSWAFEHNPCGRRIWLACEGERVVAQYAAMPRKVWIAAREAIFAEVVDSFVLRERPRALQREGLYARLGRAMAEAHCASGGDLVHYGFPTGGEWRVGNGLLDYEVVRNQSILACECGPGERELPPEVERLERFDHQARWLWDRCAGAFGASAIRDQAFLNWRFVLRPAVRYELLGVRDEGGILRGFAAFRRGEWSATPCGLLVDWLVPPEEPEVGALLVRAARARTRAAGERTLVALLPEWSPWFEAFQRAGFLVLDGGTVLFARCFARKFDEIWLREHWWTTLADSVIV